MATHLGRAATFFVALSGCVYDDAPAQPDAASTPDAAPSMPDASTVARVTVMFGEAPVAGVPVVFHGIAEVTTDSAGHASHEITPDTTVTTGWVEGPNFQLQTVLGIQPGDDVVLGYPAPFQPPPGPSGTIEVSVPPVPGATSYWFDDGCYGSVQPVNTPSATLRYSPDCLSDGKINVLVRAIDLPGTTLAVAGGSFTPPINSASLSWSQLEPFEVDLVNAPAGSMPSYIEVDPTIDNEILQWYSISRELKGDGRIFLRAPPPRMVPEFAVNAYLWYPDGSSAMDQRVAPFAPLTVDFRPFVAVPVSPMIEGSTIRWSATGPMDTVQGVRVELQGMSHDWTITLPPSTSLVLPDLPAGLAAYRPPAGTEGAVNFFSSTRFHSYADVRRMPWAAYRGFMWYSPGPYRFFYSWATIPSQQFNLRRGAK